MCKPRRADELASRRAGQIMRCAKMLVFSSTLCCQVDVPVSGNLNARGAGDVPFDSQGSWGGGEVMQLYFSPMTVKIALGAAVAIGALLALPTVGVRFAWASAEPMSQTDYGSLFPDSYVYEYWEAQAKKSDRIRYVRDPAGQRGIVQRIEIKSGDTQVYGSGARAERAEVAAKTGGLSHFVNGDSVVISFGVRVDPAFVSAPESWNIFSQVHASGGGNIPPFALSISGEEPSVQMALEGGGSWEETGQPEGTVKSRFELGPLPKGEWHDIIVALQFGCEGDGQATVWLDGRLSADASNRSIGYCDDPGMYWKQGVYRAADDTDLKLWFSDTYRWSSSSDALAHYNWDG